MKKHLSLLVLLLFVAAPVWANTPEECEDQWNAYVSAHPVGKYMVYDDVIEASGQRYVTKRTADVTESSGEEVKFNLKLEREGVPPTETPYSVLKSAYIQACENPSTVTRVIERGEAEITVPAGTFQTEFVRTLTEAQGMTTNMTAYSADIDGFPTLVKSEGTTEGNGFRSDSKSILVEYGNR